jgi:hypothetical protein
MPTISRLAGRFFSVLIAIILATLLLPVAAIGQGPTLCQITDTVYRADGTPAQGTALISWPAFTTAAGQAVTPGSLLVTLGTSGGFNASLAPNTGASPAGTYYRATFKLDDGTTDSEYWVVPNAPTTTIGAIRSKLVPSSQAAQFLTRDYADSTYVSLASTQTITGVKTFSNSPAVPAPQNPTDAANKAYVDANAGGANLSSPPPIGNTTPNTGNFTTLTSQNNNGVANPGNFPQSDPCARVNAAIADLPSSGGTIDARGFPPGQICATTITVNKPATILFGAGRWSLGGCPGIDVSSPGVSLAGLGQTTSGVDGGPSATVFSSDPPSPCPLIQSIAAPSDSATIRDLELDGNGRQGLMGIFWPWSGNLHLINVRAHDFLQQGIYAVGGLNAGHDLFLSSNGGDGVEWGSDGAIDGRTEFYGNGKAGLHIVAGGNRISNLNADFNGTQGIYLDGRLFPNWTASAAQVVGNIIRPTAGNNNAYAFVAISCTGDCKTGTSAPTWNQTPGAQIVDNHVTWLDAAALAPGGSNGYGNQVTAPNLAYNLSEQLRLEGDPATSAAQNSITAALTNCSGDGSTSNSMGIHILRATATDINGGSYFGSALNKKNDLGGLVIEGSLHTKITNFQCQFAHQNCVHVTNGSMYSFLGNVESLDNGDSATTGDARYGILTDAGTLYTTWGSGTTAVEDRTATPYSLGSKSRGTGDFLVGYQSSIAGNATPDDMGEVGGLIHEPDTGHGHNPYLPFGDHVDVGGVLNGAAYAPRFQFNNTGLAFYSPSGIGSSVTVSAPTASFTPYQMTWPATAGTSGQCLTSAGGASAPMIWGPCITSLSSPPPIGNVTPNAGAFTTLTTQSASLGSLQTVNPRAYVTAYGAVGDGQRLSQCAMTASHTTLTCSGGNFATSDAGKAINVGGAGVAGCGAHAHCPLLTTIVSCSSDTTCVLAAPAVTTVTNEWVVWGTDSTAAIQAAVDYAAYPNVHEHTVYFPRAIAGPSAAPGSLTPEGCYVITGTIQLPNTGDTQNNYLKLEGDGFLASALCQLSLGTPAVTITALGMAGTGTLIDGLGFLGPPNYADASGSAVFCNLCITLQMTEDWISAFTYGVNMGNNGASTSSQILDIHDSVFEEGISAVYWHGGTNYAVDHAATLIFTNNIMDQYNNFPFGGWVLDLYNLTGITISNNSFGPGIGQGIKCDTCQSFEIHHNDFSQATVSQGYWGQEQIYLINSSSGVVDGNSFQALTVDSELAGNNTGIAWHDNVHTQPSNAPAIVFSGSGNSVNMHDEVVASAATSGGAIRIPVSSITNTTVSGIWCAPSVVNCVVASGTVPSGSYIAINTSDLAANHVFFGNQSFNCGLWLGNPTCAFAPNTFMDWDGTNLNFYVGANLIGQMNSSQLVVPANASFSQALAVSGDLTARDIPGHEYFVSKYVSLQAAINAAYNGGAVLGTVIDDRTSPYTGPGFILYDSVTLKLAATTYTINSTMTYNNGNNVVTAGIVALPGARLIGASTSSNHGTIITAANALNADLIATSTVGTGIGSTAQWWHWGGFEDLRVTGNGANQTAGNCFNIENMGETAFLRTIEVSGCYLDNILFTGASATASDIANITTNSAGRYGFNFNNLSGVAVVHGLSGDSNTTSIVRLNGGQSGTLTILGFKTEEEISGQDPLITIDQTGQNGAQPSLYIVGGYTFGRSGVNDVIKYVNGTTGTTPYISVNNFYVQDYANAVNDVVNSRTTAAANMNKVPFYYGPTGGFLSGQAFTLDLNTFIQSPHSGNGILTEIFGTTSSNETMVAASGTSTDLSVGGIGFRMPNRTIYGQSPELFAKMTYAFPGGIPNTQQWEFIPAKVGGDNSTRWLGDPSYRWDEIYSADVNTTTATVGTLNVTTCNGCGTGTRLVSGTMQGATATLTGNSADQTIYTATLPAGTFAVGGGAHCYAKWTHPTASGAITYKWTLGTTTWAYGAYTSSSVNLASDIEVLTIASLSSQSANLSPVIAGTAIGIGGSYGNAGSENLANSDTIKLTFNGGASDQVKGATFYCQTVQ